MTKNLFLLLTIFLTACGGGNTGSAEGGNILGAGSNQNRVSAEGAILDTLADIEYFYLDIDSVSLSFDDETIIVDLTLFEIPDQFFINNQLLSDNRLEYSWIIAFDIDGNGMASNDIEIGISHYKFADSFETFSSMLDFGQQTIWLVREDGRGASLVGSFSAEVTDNTLRFIVERDAAPSLYLIDENTPFNIETYYNSGEDTFIDNLPNDEGYIYPN